MPVEYIKQILSSIINPKFIEQALAEGISEDAIFNYKLFLATHKTRGKTKIDLPWQLSAFASGLKNYKADINWDEMDNVGATPIFYIAWSGNLEQFQWALNEDKEAFNRKTSHDFTLAHYAAWSGNPAMLEFILAKDPSLLTKTTWHGLPPASYAIWFGNLPMLEYITSKDPEALSKKDGRGRILAHYAAGSGNLSMLEQILTKTPDALTVADNNGYTVAYFGVWSGNPSVLEWILAKDPTTLTRIDGNGETFAHAAAFSGNPAQLELILKSDKDALIRKTTWAHETAGHFAVRSGNPAMLELVLKHENNFLSRKNEFGQTAIHIATHSESIKQLEFILSHDKDALFRKGEIGGTVAHDIASNCPLFLEWFTSKDPAALIRKDDDGCTAAHYVAHTGNLEVFEWLLTKDKEALTRKDKKNMTVAHFAAWSGSTAVLNLILTLNPTVNAAEFADGRTLGHWAAFSGDPETFELIYKLDKDIFNRKTKQEQTVVHFAARSCYSPKLFAYLLDNYPGLTKSAWIRNKDGELPNEYRYEDHTATRPNKILEEKFLQATRSLLEESAKPNQLQLLISFKDEWQDFLLKQDKSFIDMVISEKGKFPLELQTSIAELELVPKIRQIVAIDKAIDSQQKPGNCCSFWGTKKNVEVRALMELREIYQNGSGHGDQSEQEKLEEIKSKYNWNKFSQTSKDLLTNAESLRAANNKETCGLGLGPTKI